MYLKYYIGGGLKMDDHELMFELSHPGRLKALRILSENPHRLTDLSKVLDLTSAEISRHLRRLSNADLITKDSNGRYTLTPFGGIILFELSKLNFLTSHSQYFSTHDVSVIPDELRWLNAMSKSEMTIGTLEIMSLVEDLTKNAKRHVHLISAQPLRAVTPITLKMAEQGIEVRMVYQEGADVPYEYRAKKNLPIEVRTLDKVQLALKLNESTGGIALPDMEGKIDFGFALTGSDPHFLKWVELLFDHFWQKADSL
jgi:predicted transcriptional regulator